MSTPRKSPSPSETPSTKILQHQKICFIPEPELKVFKSEYFYFHFLSGDFYWLQIQTALRTTATLNSKGLVRSRTSCQGLGKNQQKYQPQSCSPDQVFASFTVKTEKERFGGLCFIQPQKTFKRFSPSHGNVKLLGHLRVQPPSMGVSQGCPDSAHPPSAQ